MDYIVFDLEYNQPFYYKNKKLQYNKNMPFEIIEIGAVRIDNNFKLIDNFRMLIKPVVYARMHKKVAKITGITNEDLEYGFTFEFALKELKKWISKSNDYILCTWAKDDVPILVNNISFHKIDIDMDFIYNSQFLDIQEYYKYYYNSINENKNNRQTSLKNAIKQLNIEENHEFHSALQDAQYSALVLEKINQNNIDNYLISYEQYCSNIGVMDIKQIEEESSKLKFKIKCPTCGRFVKKLTTEILISNQKYKTLGVCTHCNNNILHVTRIKTINNKLYYFTQNNIVNNDEFSTVKSIILSKERIKMKKRRIYEQSIKCNH